MPKEKFSLKDYLFNKAKVTKISKEIKAVHSDFGAAKFAKKVLNKFPELELMERIIWMRDCLKEFLRETNSSAPELLFQESMCVIRIK